MARFFLLLFFSLGAQAASPQDLLEPEKAFRISARALDPATVEIGFAIAEGYYMYRERFQFAADPASGVKLGAAQFPQGVRKKDEFFGEVETYRKQVAIRLPVEGKASAFNLKVTSQGCADVTANTPEHKALLKRFALFGPPGIIFFDAEGREIKGLRVIGYQNAERFLRTLDLANAP